MTDRDALKLVDTREAWKSWREEQRNKSGESLSDDNSLLVKDAPSRSRALWTKDDVADFMKGAPEELIEEAIAKIADDKQRGAVIGAVVSDGSVDRDNDTVNPKGADFSHFRRNPVVLPFHRSDVPPVGRANAIFELDDEVRSVTQFNDPDLAMPGFVDGYVLGQMYERGFMNAFSIGFMGKSYELNEERVDRFGLPSIDFKEWELMEYSPVSIPSNRNALAEARAAGIDTTSFKQFAERILDEEGALIVPRDRIEQLYKDAGEGRRIFLMKTASAIDFEIEQPKQPSTDDLVEALEARGYSVLLQRGEPGAVLVDEDKAPAEPDPEPAKASLDARTVRAFFKHFADELDRNAGQPVRDVQTAITGRLPD